MIAQLPGAVLVVVDMQPSFLKTITGSGAVLDRCRFLVEIANLLGVPVLATEQYPSRMGGTEQGLLSLIDKGGRPPLPKMTFSCAENAQFMQQLASVEPRQIFIIGIETHICINQTAHHLLENSIQVFIGADAVGARTTDMHDLGLRRLENAGAVLAHTESIAYEWLHTAENPKFREALSIVKRDSKPAQT